MRLRFWEPVPDPPVPVGLPIMPTTPLPARRMTLTDLTAFADEMARRVNALDGYSIIAASSQPGVAYREGSVIWSDVEGMLPDARRGVVVTAAGPLGENANMGPDMVQLWIEDGLSTPARLTGQAGGLAQIEPLLRRWEQLGTARRTWAVAYPLGFLLTLAIILIPLVTLWARTELSLWLIPLVIGFVWLAFAVASPLLQGRVKNHRASRSGLDIDYRLLEKVRLDRAVQRRNLYSGLIGGLLGAVATLIGVWITVAAGK